MPFVTSVSRAVITAKCDCMSPQSQVFGRFGWHKISQSSRPPPPSPSLAVVRARRPAKKQIGGAVLASARVPSVKRPV